MSTVAEDECDLCPVLRAERDAAIARAEAAEAHAVRSGAACADALVAIGRAEARALRAEAACATLRAALAWAEPHIGDEYQNDWPTDERLAEGCRRVSAALAADNPGAPLLAALRQAADALPTHAEECGCDGCEARAAIRALGLPGAP